MSNIYALKPATDGANPKFAAEGARMFRRADAMAVVRKMKHYTIRNISVARDEARWDDAEVQEIRLRTLNTVMDGLMCCPEFINPTVLYASPLAPGRDARSGETEGLYPEDDGPVGESRDAQPHSGGNNG
jgi:hypothetical protein